MMDVENSEIELVKIYEDMKGRRKDFAHIAFCNALQKAPELKQGADVRKPCVPSIYRGEFMDDVIGMIKIRLKKVQHYQYAQIIPHEIFAYPEGEGPSSSEEGMHMVPRIVREPFDPEWPKAKKDQKNMESENFWLYYLVNFGTQPLYPIIHPPDGGGGRGVSIDPGYALVIDQGWKLAKPRNGKSQRYSVGFSVRLSNSNSHYLSEKIYQEVCAGRVPPNFEGKVPLLTSNAKRRDTEAFALWVERCFADENARHLILEGKKNVYPIALDELVDHYVVQDMYSPFSLN